MLKTSFFVGLAILAISACGQKSDSTESSNLTEIIQNQVSNDSLYNPEIDNAFKHLQARLPYKAGNFMEISSLERTGKDIHYNFTILSEAITPQIFGLEDSKQVAIHQLCGEEDTQKFLAAGYQMHFNYTFRNQETVTLMVNQSSCNT